MLIIDQKYGQVLITMGLPKIFSDRISNNNFLSKQALFKSKVLYSDAPYVSPRLVCGFAFQKLNSMYPLLYKTLTFESFRFIYLFSFSFNSIQTSIILNAFEQIDNLLKSVIASLFDNEVISETSFNFQVIALHLSS